jgi:hypothetical protein
VLLNIHNDLCIIYLNLTLKTLRVLASHFFKLSNNKLSKYFFTLNKCYFLIVHNSIVTWSSFYLLEKGRTLARFAKSNIKKIIIFSFWLFKFKEKI